MTGFGKIFLFIIFTSFLYSCSKGITPSKKPSHSGGVDNYEEDLSLVRNKYEKADDETNIPADRKLPREKYTNRDIELPNNNNAKIDNILDTLALRNKNIRFMQGYRIQVYVGNNRTEYDEARSFLLQNHPELSMYPSYSAPTYRLKAGDFTSKMDAERYYQNIKARYSTSLIIADRIDIRKSMQIK